MEVIMQYEGYQPVRRDFKDSLFRMIFKEKENLLSLYNAVSGTNYTDPSLIEIVTLENAIYKNLKNDLAFTINGTLHLYEHQSTYCANMPYRNLCYVTREFEKVVANENPYSTRRMMLPEPHFTVFYNGKYGKWKEHFEKLSDSYLQRNHQLSLELMVRGININPAINPELLESCKPLKEYTQYVEKVHTYAEIMELSEAVQRAVDESIKEGILADILTKFKAEAIQVTIFEYDEEKVMQMLRQEMKEDAKIELRDEVEAQVRAEMSDKIKEEVKEEIGEKIREEVREEIGEKIREEVKEEIEGKIREEVKDKIRGELEDKVREEVKNKIRGELEDKVREEVEDKVRNEVREEVQAQVKDELRNEMLEEVRKQVLNEQCQQDKAKSINEVLKRFLAIIFKNSNTRKN